MQKTAYEMRISDWSSDVCSSDLFGVRDGFLQAIEHLVGHGVHLGLERGHGDVVAVGPQADAVVLEHRLALRERFAQQRVGEALALVDGQGGAGQLRVLAGAVRSEEHTSELQSLMRIPYAVF